MDAFCPRCGGLLVPGDKADKLVCTCGYSTRTPVKIKITESVKESKKGEGIGKKVEDTLSKTKEDCPECKHKEAYWWMQQTRAADEPETRFFKCCKCGYTWREYD